MVGGNAAQSESERRPLLSPGHHSRSQQSRSSHGDHQQQDQNEDEHKVEFEEDDQENPREWSLKAKYAQVLQIFIIALILPMASSIFAPALDEMASDLGTSKQIALLGQTGYVCMLGIGPLFHAPMSETFGRRLVYVLNLIMFALVQIPTALAPNIATYLTFRVFAGFFGSVGVANGGGTIADMFETHQRAQVVGIYIMAPLLAPSIGPFIGGLVISSSSWRWIFWIMFILSAAVSIMSLFFLQETRAVTILQKRKSRLESKHPETNFVVEGAPNQSILSRIRNNSTRALRILTTQPIVMTMSLYQALIFSSMYSLYAQFDTIFSSEPYNFNSVQIGLTYLAPAIGFLLNAAVVVTYIDKVYTALASKHDNDGKPEYRLPLANIGAVLLPISLFWLGWSVEKDLTWPVPLTAALLFGASQVSIFNTVQTYYIDSFESNAASALAAGSFLRSMVGGVVPVFVAGMFDKLGYGLGMSVFGILSVILMPVPALFYWYGETLREKFPFKG